MGTIPHVKAGDLITAELFNAVAEKLERFANLKSGSPYVRLWETPTGKAIALAFPQPTYAMLSGSSSPYSFTEVRDGPGGTWDTMPNGDFGTGNVYEVNGKAGLGGKVVPIEWTAAGDWRFQWVGYGPPNCTGKGNTLCFHLQACGNVPGADVDFVLGGVTVFSGTTDSSGNCCYFEPDPGTYTINWSVSGTSFSGTKTATVLSTCVNVSVGDTIATPAGWSCICGCPLPVPPLFVTDAAGTRSAASIACFSFNGAAVSTSFNVDCSTTPATFFVGQVFRYGGNCALINSPCVNTVGGAWSGVAFNSSPISSCLPFSASGTYPTTSGGCPILGIPPQATPLQGGFIIHT